MLSDVQTLKIVIYLNKVDISQKNVLNEKNVHFVGISVSYTHLSYIVIVNSYITFDIVSVYQGFNNNSLLSSIFLLIK